MQITSANLSIFFTALNTNFWTTYQTTPVVYQKIATVIPVSTEIFAAGWIGSLDIPREWLGSRETKMPGPQTYFVPIRNFEMTQGIDKFKLEDDQQGIYSPMAMGFAKNMAKLPDYQLRDLINGIGSYTGIAQKAPDGINQWATNHPVDVYDSSKGTYSTDFRGGFSVNGVTVGGALSMSAFSTLWQEIAARKSENGQPMGLMARTLLHAPQLKFTADSLLQAQFLASPTVGNLAGQVGSAENMLRGWSDPLMWGDLAAYPNRWYQLVTDLPQKPFTWLNRKSPDFVTRTSPQDPTVVNAHTYLMGSEARGSAAWGPTYLSAISGPSE